METIIVKPKNAEEAKEVLGLLKKMKVKIEVYEEQTKQEVLSSIERGARDVARHLKGEIKLKDARQLLNEL